MVYKLNLFAFPPLFVQLAAQLAVQLRALASARKRRGPQPLGAADLRAMSDMELKDLGIGRSEIPALLGDADRHQGFWR